MKKNIFRSCSSALVVAAGLLAAAIPASGQSILITINDTVPTAVTFTTTGNNSFANSSTVYNQFGVDFINFFTTSVSGSGAVTGNLTPAGTAVGYSSWVPDSFQTSGTRSLNLYATAFSQLQNFNTASAAFTGTATIDLSSVLAGLPVGYATGNIYSGDARSPGVLIGKWVVPEPSVKAQLALGAMLFAGLALIRRARRAAASR
jgi:hypothetical protein